LIGFIWLEIFRAVIPMSRKKYTVDLTEEQRDELESLISSGVHRIQKVTRARILLKVDDNWTDKDISEALDCGVSTVKRMRERFTENGITAIQRRDPDREYERKLDGEDEAHLIALANSEPPEGRARWTLRLLADELVTLGEIDHESLSHQTVHEVLKKTSYSLIDPSNG
jgi:transposase